MRPRAGEFEKQEPIGQVPAPKRFKLDLDRLLLLARAALGDPEFDHGHVVIYSHGVPR